MRSPTRAIVWSLAFAALACVIGAALSGNGSLRAEEAMPKDDKSKEKGKDGEATYDDPKDLAALMKEVGSNARRLKKALEDKDAKRMVEGADKLRFYASRALDKDKDEKRKGAEDYKKWMKEFEELARDLRKQAEAKTVKWEDIKKKHDELGANCKACHSIYKPEEDKPRR